MTDITKRDAVVIERIVEAPVDVVWNMWTNPDHFEGWYGPPGATIRVAQMDLRVGGKRRVSMEMQTPNGVMQMWFSGEYREITVNERLVYTEFVSDAVGNPILPTSAGPPDAHSLTEVRIDLEGLDGRTRMVLTHVGIPAGSPGESGWIMAFDKLAAALATTP